MWPSETVCEIAAGKYACEYFHRDPERWYAAAWVQCSGQQFRADTLPDRDQPAEAQVNELEVWPAVPACCASITPVGSAIGATPVVRTNPDVM
jgi:hypothetical protein